MKRTNSEHPEFIVTGDWHLRDTIPKCRTDDFMAAQWSKVDAISELQKIYQCPVVHSGDLFNHWKPSPYLLAETIKHLPKQFYTIYGNHDLPGHNWNERDKSGINVLAEAGLLTVLPGCHWNVPILPEHDKLMPDFLKNVRVMHVMTYAGDLPWPGCGAFNANELLSFYSKQLVITGHNHKTFIGKVGKRGLVNPGSLTRQTADQIDHAPCIFLWYREGNRLEQIFLPFDMNVISTDHLIKTEQKNARLEAFITEMSEDWKSEVSFEKNLEKYFSIHNTRQAVQDLIWGSLK